MKIEQTVWREESGWNQDHLPGTQCKDAQLVLIFAPTDLLEKNVTPRELSTFYPHAQIIGCASGNEIWDSTVTENALVVTALQFDKATIQVTTAYLTDPSQSKQCGIELIEKLPKENLKHIFVLCDGIKIDGTTFVEGMIEHLPDGIGLTGGLASDGERLKRTPVYFLGKPQENCAVAIGFYGDTLTISYACEAGWKAYGLERIVTKSKNNILYELDHKPALTLYKEFLGPYADRLPLIGGLYPLAIREQKEEKQLARTIFAINEEEHSISLCGGVPEGSRTQFMMTNVTKLVEGAESAATRSKNLSNEETPQLVLLLSCYARKQVLKQRVEEEIEVVRDILGDQAVFTGFYSYGEISPFGITEQCYLHNQTMAITTIKEK